MILQQIQELVSLCAAHGIKEAIISPGSRSASISIAFEHHPEVNVRVISDERAAAFIGMGIAQQSQVPVALVCTSGSAAYNYAPAVAEAYYQEIPLLVITADRPPEWVDQYDGQTIKQTNIYGGHVKRSFDLPPEQNHEDVQWHNNRMINEALIECRQAPLGPVHLNVPIREPFYPLAGERYSFLTPRAIHFPSTKKSLSDQDWQRLTAEWNDANKRMLVVGQNLPDSALTKVLSSFSEDEIIILNEITGNQHGLSNALSKQDLFLNQQSELESPDLLITLGNSFISKNLKIFLRNHPATNHWHIREGFRLNDSLKQLSSTIDMRSSDFLRELSVRISSRPNATTFNESWREKNSNVQQRSLEFLQKADLSELKAYQICLKALPQNSLLHLSNSMAVRYANFLGIDDPTIDLFCNRGTSGIDGSNSTAVGASLASDKIVTLITGDMAFFYDRNAFWHNENLGRLRIIVMNNAGGGIFGMIKGPRNQASYPKLFHTEQGLKAQHLSEEFGFSYSACQTTNELEKALEDFFTPSENAKIIEVFSEAEFNEEQLKAFKNYCLD